MQYTKPVFIDENLAFSPMPSNSDIDHIAEEFDVVISVTSRKEMRYNYENLASRIEFYLIPIPDHTWPTLQQLHYIISLISDKTMKNLKVLVHCREGLGRSAAVASSYLVYRYGLTAQDAIRHIRSLRPNSLINPGLEGVVRAYEAYLMVHTEQPVGGLGFDKQELLRVIGMLVESLAYNRIIGLHEAYSVMKTVMMLLSDTREATRDDELSIILAEGRRVSPKIALIDLQHLQQGGTYVLKAVLASYDDRVDLFLNEMSNLLVRKYKLKVKDVEVVVEYW